MAPQVEKEPRDAHWADGLVVDEKRLQEYLARKQHGLLLAGAAELLKKTLVQAPCTHAGDGTVHFGDSLMLCSQRTNCPLQADVTCEIPVYDDTFSSKKEFTATSLSTGKIMYACPRNVFTLSRATDDDGYWADPVVHYGQAIRITANLSLCDRPMYVYAGVLEERTDAQQAEENEGDARSLATACLFPRAARRAVWNIVH